MLTISANSAYRVGLKIRGGEEGGRAQFTVMFVTLPTFHLLRSPVKEDALLNKPCGRRGGRQRVCKPPRRRAPPAHLRRGACGAGLNCSFAEC